MRTARIHGTLEERNAARLARSSSKRMRYEEIKKEENARIEKEAQEKRVVKLGRPTLYTEKLVVEICKEIASGKSLRAVCRREDMPNMDSVFEWLGRYQAFAEQYARATEARTDAQNEDLLEMGDEAIALATTLKGPQASAVVQAIKIKADNLRWVMSKMKPKRYGDKLDVTSGGEVLPMPILGGQAFLALDKAQEAAMVRHSEVIHTLPASPTKKTKGPPRKG